MPQGVPSLPEPTILQPVRDVRSPFVGSGALGPVLRAPSEAARHISSIGRNIANILEPRYQERQAVAKTVIKADEDDPEVLAELDRLTKGLNPETSKSKIRAVGQYIEDRLGTDNGVLVTEYQWAQGLALGRTAYNAVQADLANPEQSKLIALALETGSDAAFQEALAQGRQDAEAHPFLGASTIASNGFQAQQAVERRRLEKEFRAAVQARRNGRFRQEQVDVMVLGANGRRGLVDLAGSDTEESIRILGEIHDNLEFFDLAGLNEQDGMVVALAQATDIQADKEVSLIMFDRAMSLVLSDGSRLGGSGVRADVQSKLGAMRATLERQAREQADREFTINRRRREELETQVKLRAGFVFDHALGRDGTGDIQAAEEEARVSVHQMVDDLPFVARMPHYEREAVIDSALDDARNQALIQGNSFTEAEAGAARRLIGNLIAVGKNSEALQTIAANYSGSLAQELTGMVLSPGHTQEAVKAFTDPLDDLARVVKDLEGTPLFEEAAKFYSSATRDQAEFLKGTHETAAAAQKAADVKIAEIRTATNALIVKQQQQVQRQEEQIKEIQDLTYENPDQAFALLDSRRWLLTFDQETALEAPLRVLRNDLDLAEGRLERNINTGLAQAMEGSRQFQDPVLRARLLNEASVFSTQSARGLRLEKSRLELEGNGPALASAKVDEFLKLKGITPAEEVRRLVVPDRAKVEREAAVGLVTRNDVETFTEQVFDTRAREVLGIEPTLELPPLVESLRTAANQYLTGDSSSDEFMQDAGLALLSSPDQKETDALVTAVLATGAYRIRGDRLVVETVLPNEPDALAALGDITESPAVREAVDYLLGPIVGQEFKQSFTDDNYRITVRGNQGPFFKTAGAVLEVKISDKVKTGRTLALPPIRGDVPKDDVSRALFRRLLDLGPDDDLDQALREAARLGRSIRRR